MKHRTNIRSERGQTMTEFAIILPILLVLLFGIIQFGIVFNNYVTVTDAVRAGSRKAAVSRPLGPGGAEAAAIDEVRSSASDLNQSSLNVTVSSSWQPGTDVTVTADYPYSISLLGWVVKSGRLTTTTKERVE